MRRVSCLLFSLLLVGCGNKGPLYLPDQPAQSSSTGTDKVIIDSLDAPIEAIDE